ncbi:MAG: hypothetical protein Q8S03_00860 [Brevundimonas sp.]|uniref:hypothetical protein n=1 Tax=Brevundimonas sp. TaxID=1871086 RepID=UPI0027330ED7|nr:hypothetical protein [Brevundimonas sp.]MDP3403204.1 hypothetical protein [Brevundimonas sp.]
MKRGWFGPRRIGWGASPTSWEGWLATGAMVLTLIGVSIGFGDRPNGWIAQMAVIAAFSIVVLLTYRHDARTPF